MEKTIGDKRMIDGVKYELAMWLQVEARADGIPLTLRLCQPGQTIEEELIAAKLCTREEIANGTAQERLKPTMHLMWTQSAWLVKERA